MDLRTIIRQARAGVSFSGAGLSVAAGLPTYRAGGGAVWTRWSPDAFSERRRLADPEGFWADFRAAWLPLMGAEPAAPHRALAALERDGCLRGHITQNVDGLLQAAGARDVIELHGDLRHLRYDRCGARSSMDAVRSAAVPVCARCGEMLRPGVVMFGDALDPDRLALARRWLREADLVLVVGTSLDVEPAARLLRRCPWRSPTVIVDPDPPPLRGPGIMVLRAPAEEALPLLASWRAGACG